MDPKQDGTGAKDLHNDKRPKYHHAPGSRHSPEKMMSELRLGRIEGGPMLRRGSQLDNTRPQFVPLGQDSRVMALRNYSAPNQMTSPDRLSRAELAAQLSRQFRIPIPPPPQFIYKRTGDLNFNIFHGFLLYPDLVLLLANELRVKELISLYAMSRDFHTILDTRLRTVILDQAKRKCPESALIFSYRCYPSMCRADPVARNLETDPKMIGRVGETRQIPSFRWLQMIMFREKVCHEIMALMAEEGVPMPPPCERVLKKIWFIAEIPDNGRRASYIHAEHTVSDMDLYFMMCITIKLDMRFNHPLTDQMHHGMRKLILAQPGLTSLWRLLKGTILTNRYEVMKMWVATKHTPRDQDKHLPIFGIPANKIGRRSWEYWGSKEKHPNGKMCGQMLRPDQLTLREIVRRDMDFAEHYEPVMMWGYVDPKTLDNYKPKVLNRRILGLEEEYEDDDEVGGLVVDDLENPSPHLDLGLPTGASTQLDRSGTNGKTKTDRSLIESCIALFKEETKAEKDDEMGAGEVETEELIVGEDGLEMDVEMGGIDAIE